MGNRGRCFKRMNLQLFQQLLNLGDRDKELCKNLVETSSVLRRNLKVESKVPFWRQLYVKRHNKGRLSCFRELEACRELP